MTSYKPKIFRSQDGCCICRAKSSSSRFTDSERYSECFQGCFRLFDTREGEICNACVLIVKRWKKLPLSTDKNWAHVVDARSGPGTKQVVKTRKKEEEEDGEVLLKYKHVYRRKAQASRSCSPCEGSNRSDTPSFTAAATPGVSSVASTAAESSSLYPDFIDASYWKRCIVCCGVIFVGQLGEVMLDQRFYKKCSEKKHNLVDIDKEEQEVEDVTFCSELSDDLIEEESEFYSTGDKKHNKKTSNSEEEELESELETFKSVNDH